MLLGSHLEKITSITTVQRGLKGSSCKIPINFPKLKDPAQYLHYICQFSWRQDDDALYTPKQKKRTEHLLRVHWVIQHFTFKNKETVFYSIADKPAVAHILKTLLEHDLHDMNILNLFELNLGCFWIYLDLTNA